MGGLARDLCLAEIQTQKLVVKINLNLNELKKVALNINSYDSTTEYLNIQIKCEEQARKPGWDKRVVNLKEAMRKAEALSSMAGQKLED